MGGSVCADAVAPRAIAGGFVLISARGLIAAWRACRTAPLGVGDFRAWIACREMLARRAPVDAGRTPTYGHAELSRLAAVSEKRARASVKRLSAAGLLTWSEHGIAFPDAGDPDDSLHDTIGGGQGDIAVPRRMLRLLARGARPALIATALAAILRCLSRGRGGFKSRGRLKAAWVARAFGVDVRRVKQARKELVDMGWLVPETTPQWAMNRWGAVYHLDLAWGGARLPPPHAAGGRRTPPPDSDPDPLREVKNQAPAPGGPAGDRFQGTGEGTVPPSTAASGGRGPADDGTPPPRLDDVRAEDLKDTARLLALRDQAAARGLVGASESDRLKFVAAAEHALSAGKSNPCGLFASLVRRGQWRFATQGDEDSASRRLKRHLFGAPMAVNAAAAPSVVGRPRLSEDAALAREVRSALARSGVRADPFPAVRSRDPSWTRARWDAALAELASWRSGV